MGLQMQLRRHNDDEEKSDSESQNSVRYVKAKTRTKLGEGKRGVVQNRNDTSSEDE